MKASIEDIRTMSSHADQGEILDWLSEIKNKPEKVFIIHGEQHAAQVLRVKINDKYGWPCVVTQLLDKFQLNSA